MGLKWVPTEGKWIIGFAIGASRVEGDLRAVLYFGPRKLQIMRGELANDVVNEPLPPTKPGGGL